MSWMRFGVLLISLLLTGCANRNGTVIQDLCIVDSPITISNDDVLTEQTAVQIESHNFLWDHLCP